MFTVDRRLCYQTPEIRGFMVVGIIISAYNRCKPKSKYNNIIERILCIMTIDEVITVLNDKDVSIRWDGMCYSLRLRNIPRGFFADYQRIDSLHTAGILDDEAAANTIMKLAEKYKGEVSDSNV